MDGCLERTFMIAAAVWFFVLLVITEGFVFAVGLMAGMALFLLGLMAVIDILGWTFYKLFGPHSMEPVYIILMLVITYMVIFKLMYLI